MRAIIYTEYGPPEVLRVAEVAKPAPKADEVLIKVRAAEVTKADCELRSFEFVVKWFWLPLRIAMGIRRPRRIVPGNYYSGVIEALGESVTRFKAGDEVFGTCDLRMSAHAEYLCVPGKFTIVHKPVNMTFEEAAASPMGGTIALHFMRLAAIRPGESVLINGAGGSIGTFAAQIAKAAGAEVTAVDSGIKEESLRRIGIDYFIDYTKTNFARTGKTYDVVFSIVGGASYSDGIAALKPNGRFFTANPSLADMARSFLTGWFTKKSASFRFASEGEEDLLELKRMIEAGKIVSNIDRVFSMDEIQEAHRRVETEQRLGPVVIRIGG